MATIDPEEINAIISRYRRESRALTNQIYEICWYMRGGVTREEAWHLCYSERKGIMKQIENNVERVNKTGLPIL